MLLVFLLIILIITSQFEWRQPLVADVDMTPAVSQKQQKILKREEAVKEKVIVPSNFEVIFFILNLVYLLYFLILIPCIWSIVAFG